MALTEAWIIVLVTALCTFVIVGTLSLVLVSYCCRRARRRRQVSELKLASIETVEQGLSQLSEKTPSDEDVRSLNKSMRRLLPSHRIRVHARTSVWNFARPDLIRKLGFDKWQFECKDQPILSVATFSLSIFNRSTQPLRVRIHLQSAPDNGAGVRANSPVPASMNSINLLHIEPRAIECVTLEVMPLVPGSRCLFLSVTPQSVEDDHHVDFAPYYLPMRIHSLPLTENLQTYKFSELIGDKKPLGRGAAAVVYERTLATTGQVVAVKQFTITNATKMDVQEFLNEAKVLSRYSHPCVVQLLGVCTEFPNCSLILEYVPLGSLDRYVRPDTEVTQPPSWPLRIKFAIDGARALAYLHLMDVLHRDIKDANFLVSSLDPLQEVNLKLSDFSMSKDLSGTKPSPRPVTIEETKRNNRLTLAGTGTVQWKAVEVMRGDAETKASDVWSFGVVLWQLATLKIPYSDTCKVFDIEKVVQSGKRLNLTRSDTPSMPSGYPEVVQQCLNENIDQRPSFEHLVDILCDMQRRKGWWRVSSSAAIMRAQRAYQEDEDDEAFSEDNSDDDDDENIGRIV